MTKLLNLTNIRDEAEISNKLKYKNYLLSFFCGFLLPFSFAPFNHISTIFAYLIFPLIAFFYYQLRHATQLKTAAIQSGLFGFGLYLSGVSWIYVAIHEFGSTPWWLAGILTLLFISVLASLFVLQGSLSFILMKKLLNKSINHKTRSLDSILYLIIFPLLWVFFEWIRTWLLTGFPWLLIAYSQISTSLSGFSPIVGVYGLSLISATIAGAVILLIGAGVKQKPVFKIKIFILILGVFLCGYFLQQQNWTTATGKSFRVSMVQANISQHSRWKKDFTRNIKKQYYNLSRDLWHKTDIIVWPENAIPVFYQYEEKGFFKKIKNQVDKFSVSFITGVPYLNRAQSEYYNSLLRIEKESTAFYFKQHLVPFGEYVPMEKWLRGLIELFNIPMSGFSLPPQQQKIMTIKGVPVAITLCYEDTFPNLLLKQLPEAQLLINLSNNGWYGDSFAPHQHLQIAQMRALESGRNLIRSTTSGISAFINHKGQIIKQSPQFKMAILSGTIETRTGATPYVKYGNIFVIIYTILMLGILLIFWNKSSKLKN